jgi:hypothetical protein
VDELRWNGSAARQRRLWSRQVLLDAFIPVKRMLFCLAAGTRGHRREVWRPFLVSLLVFALAACNQSTLSPNGSSAPHGSRKRTGRRRPQTRHLQITLQRVEMRCMCTRQCLCFYRFLSGSWRNLPSRRELEDRHLRADRASRPPASDSACLCR